MGQGLGRTGEGSLPSVQGPSRRGEGAQTAPRRGGGGLSGPGARSTWAPWPLLAAARVGGTLHLGRLRTPRGGTLDPIPGVMSDGHPGLPLTAPVPASLMARKPSPHGEHPGLSPTRPAPEHTDRQRPPSPPWGTLDPDGRAGRTGGQKRQVSSGGHPGLSPAAPVRRAPGVPSPPARRRLHHHPPYAPMTSLPPS